MYLCLKNLKFLGLGFNIYKDTYILRKINFIKNLIFKYKITILTKC